MFVTQLKNYRAWSQNPSVVAHTCSLSRNGQVFRLRAIQPSHFTLALLLSFHFIIAPRQTLLQKDDSVRLGLCKPWEFKLDSRTSVKPNHVSNPTVHGEPGEKTIDSPEAAHREPVIPNLCTLMLRLISIFPFQKVLAYAIVLKWCPFGFRILSIMSFISLWPIFNYFCTQCDFFFLYIEFWGP